VTDHTLGATKTVCHLADGFCDVKREVKRAKAKQAVRSAAQGELR
jgi:hypothetical protein